MRQSFTSGAALLVLLLLTPLRAIAAPSQAEKQVFDELNQERKNAGLPALEWNELAADAARRHAGLMAQNGELSHQFAGEPSLPERLGSTGARFTNAAENIARTEFMEDVHLALMNSPGHRANMLSSRYNALGIGVVVRGGRVYVAQDFVFQVPVYTEADFNSAFAEAFNLARRARGMQEIEAEPDRYLHELACSTDGDASKLSGHVSGPYVVVFNSSEPRRLPEKMMRVASSSAYRRMSFGTCFRPDVEHGYGNFWVVAVFSADRS